MFVLISFCNLHLRSYSLSLNGYVMLCYVMVNKDV